ncbi:CLUMA_CG012409, isoform A [Clunio marinus]|uniref:CLUMA_CG012409, isoform A n=1 Tax=Clunio marinus TaxID=568069 RepID=A0A1J1IKV1_9DIPT|nr:CLUMA_CG012409, isoform A [Clunio marinus]
MSHISINLSKSHLTPPKNISSNMMYCDDAVRSKNREACNIENLMEYEIQSSGKDVRTRKCLMLNCFLKQFLNSNFLDPNTFIEF